MNSDREISNLYSRYAELTDRGEFDALGELFAEANFSLNGGAAIRGATAIATLGRATLQRYEDGTPKTHHVTTNLFIEVDEEAGTAIGRAYFTVFQALPGFPLQPIAAGRYDDRFARRAGSWSFDSRRVLSDFFGDVSHHVTDHS